MKFTNKHSRTSAILLSFCFLFLCARHLFAQERAEETRRFATKGTTELGGSFSVQSIAPVSNGNTGDATTIISFAPFIGYFVSDGFELGVNPLGITSISSGGGSATQVNIFVAPSYNFSSEGNTYPFVEALMGYTSQSNGSSRGGFSWGGRGGVKIAITDKGLLNIGVQYIQITLNRSGASTRSGSNQFAATAGFTIWL